MQLNIGRSQPGIRLSPPSHIDLFIIQIYEYTSNNEKLRAQITQSQKEFMISNFIEFNLENGFSEDPNIQVCLNLCLKFLHSTKLP